MLFYHSNRKVTNRAIKHVFEQGYFWEIKQFTPSWLPQGTSISYAYTSHD